MKSINAKFKCTSVTDFGSVKQAKMNAVYGNDGENTDFFNATPAGELSLTINISTSAFDFFKPGIDYYLTITESRVTSFKTMAEEPVAYNSESK